MSDGVCVLHVRTDSVTTTGRLRSLTVARNISCAVDLFIFKDKRRDWKLFSFLIGSAERGVLSKECMSSGEVWLCQRVGMLPTGC